VITEIGVRLLAKGESTAETQVVAGQTGVVIGVFQRSVCVHSVGKCHKAVIVPTQPNLTTNLN